ncbi:TIGR01777 family oxidoreductase [Aestuariibacter sp. AA17]|uniref:TIGR01777 family oxidoreductase n=1 Tax=Fluctibacter corallii TaxID=2984329 RepID=A0ABT3A573_9ALTE|nr:TIGR01777 family oxidoreductase [Aestuariibacter sp. AA17]MCV2883848.1 TIGR01777 family oxidoreductase [Aestuariibacter sp. AA17]
MRVLITGATGLIGSHLIPHLQQQADLTALTRNVSRAEMALSNHNMQFISSLASLSNLNEFDAVINLAGEPIVNKRWTAAQKQRIEESRWGITQQLADLIRASTSPPSVLISGSAIGFYGRQGNEIIDEGFNSPHDEFSHQLCARWEQIALEAASENTRVCILRTGIVLSKKGGALSKMLLPFKLGLGGPMGTGNQYMSWIHIDDMISAILFLLSNADCEGVYNFTAPTPVTNSTFSKELARQLRRPCLLRTPSFALKLLMGEMSDLLLTGQRVVPKRLQEAGYPFKYPTLADALANLHL